MRIRLTFEDMPTQSRRACHPAEHSERGRSPLLRDFTRQRHRVQGRALVRRCALPSKMRTGFRKCASWKTPTISSKVRTLLQGAHRKLHTFAETARVRCCETAA